MTASCRWCGATDQRRLREYPATAGRPKYWACVRSWECLTRRREQERVRA